MEINDKRAFIDQQNIDKGNMDSFLEGSTLTRLRNLFEARSDQFYMGFTVIKHTVTKYWPEKFIEQLRLVDPNRFNNDTEDEQILSKATLKNYMNEDSTDWKGIDKVITAMERTREEILSKEK